MVPSQVRSKLPEGNKNIFNFCELALLNVFHLFGYEDADLKLSYGLTGLRHLLSQAKAKT